jgi:hypothetical protein
MKILSPSEVACVYCRLGWLNLYNPCKPEGAWELDMSRREERVIAKTLCVLATNEPGDNWVFETFRWMRSMESMPGWELVSAATAIWLRVWMVTRTVSALWRCGLAVFCDTTLLSVLLLMYLSPASQTQPWLTEEGMPMRGLVNITYYSGEGQGKKGCRPYISFRKALLNLVSVVTAFMRVVMALSALSASIICAVLADADAVLRNIRSSSDAPHRY